MKFSNHWGNQCVVTHLRIKLVHTADSFLDPSVLDSLPDFHPFLYHVLIDCGRDPSLPGEFNSCIGKALDHQVVEDQSIEITVTLATTTIKAYFWEGVRGANIKGVLKRFRRDSHLQIVSHPRRGGVGRDVGRKDSPL